jgi:hypothetical protein
MTQLRHDDTVAGICTSYCYVRHYGTGQANAESDDLADPAEERRPGKTQRVEDAPEGAQQVALAC